MHLLRGQIYKQCLIMPRKMDVKYDKLPEPNKRIYDLIQEYCEGNAKKFAERIGVSQQVISRIFKIDTRSNENKYPSISDDIKKGILNEFGLDEVWILTGKNSESLNNGNLSPARGIINKGEQNYRLVPVVHIDSVGGMSSNNSITNEPQYIEGYVPFVNAREDDRAIIQSGNSMIPTIPPGSLVQIREVINWREYFGYGNIFVIELTDGRRITKEVQKDENPDNILCVSHNPKVAAEPLPKSMIASVWKVINILIGKGW